MKKEEKTYVRPELKDHILAYGSNSVEENLRIFEKWFANGPRYLFRAADRKYQNSSKVICDVGCSYGVSFLYSAPGYYGIECPLLKSNRGKAMEISTKEARARLSDLLKRAENREEVLLLRRGKKVARLVPAQRQQRLLPFLREFRSSNQGYGSSHYPP